MTHIDHELPDGCTDEYRCRLAATAEVLGRKWRPVILECLHNEGACTFSELNHGIDGISNKALSNNLEDLEELDLVDRSIVSEKPIHVEYSLTEAGTDLEPVLREMEEWASAHIDASNQLSTL